MANDGPPPLLPVKDAIARILAAMQPTAAEDVTLTEALGRVTAEPVVSRRTQPPRPFSAMDGYAVRAADVAAVPARLERVGSAPAGRAWTGTVGPGQAVRIFTGGPLPDGADTIVIQEDVDAASEQDGAEITVREGAPAGTYVRAAGLDFKVGDVGVPAGRAMTARDIGLAAAMNVPWVRVRRKPRVAVLSTGDEIVRPGDPIGPDQIVSSNSLALCALITACGGEPVNLGIAPDTVDGLQALARGARGADLVVTTGGASVGEHDLIRSALGPEAFGPDGLVVDFWQIAMRPGKPLIFGRIGGVPMLGLPGNPVSTLVCALLFLRPALAALLGLPAIGGDTATARLAAPMKANDRREDYMRATLETAADGALFARPYSRQDSSMLSHMAHADCLIVRPPHDPARAAGDPVTILRLGQGLVAL
jgi:molybdopterin molybdotransferase